MQQNAAREAKRTKFGFCTELCTKGIFGAGPDSKIPLFYLVHPSGVEPETFGFVGRCSIQLSYGCLNEITGYLHAPIRSVDFYAPQ